MIFKAIVCLAVAAVLIPHEPDLGFGRPGPQTSLLQSATSWASGALSPSSSASASGSTQASGSLCTDHAAACVAALGVLDSVQAVTVRGLAQVKADIEAQQHERALRVAGN
jgi:hypothetical protein